MYLFSSLTGILDINSATLSGCIDIICIRQPDGSLRASPFHVRFGKLKLLKSKQKSVTIAISGKEIKDVHMVIDGQGEAFFVRTELVHESTDAQQECFNHMMVQHSQVSPAVKKVGGGPKSQLDESEDLQGVDEVEPDRKKYGGAKSENNLPQYSDDENMLIDELNKLQQDKAIKAQKAGLWQSLYGYFRSKPKDQAPALNDPLALNHAKSALVQEGLTGLGYIEPREDVNISDDAVSNQSSSDSGDTLIEMSLCLDLFKQEQPQSLTEMNLIFLRGKVNYEQFACTAGEMMQDPNLVVRIDEKQYYEWRDAQAIVMSYLVFKQALPQEQMGPSLNSRFIPRTSSQGDNSLTPAVPKPKSSQKGLIADFDKAIEIDEEDDKDKEEEEYMTAVNDVQQEAASAAADLEELNLGFNLNLNEELAQVQEEVKSLDNAMATSPQDELEGAWIRVEQQTLFANSEQLKLMDLQPGQNEITFTVSSTLQGKQVLRGNIFLWDYQTRLVISDIDGTITKSDMLGHIMPRIGQDWSQPAICDLYQKVHNNGYQFLYLTARAIGQSETTKQYVTTLKQNQQFLPKGPILTSPDRFIHSFKRELIHKKPQVFKIACLKNIRHLFPDAIDPFYAGFGNRETDAVSYKEVGVPVGKIFIVNPSGQLSHHDQSLYYEKTYKTLAEIVDMVFTPVTQDLEASQVKEQFNDFNYWKRSADSLSSLSDDDLLL